jgi:hypothetical protein
MLQPSASAPLTTDIGNTNQGVIAVAMVAP